MDHSEREELDNILDKSVKEVELILNRYEDDVGYLSHSVISNLSRYNTESPGVKLELLKDMKRISKMTDKVLNEQNNKEIVNLFMDLRNELDRYVSKIDRKYIDHKIYGY